MVVVQALFNISVVLALVPAKGIRCPSSRMAELPCSSLWPRLECCSTSVSKQGEHARAYCRRRHRRARHSRAGHRAGIAFVLPRRGDVHWNLARHRKRLVPAAGFELRLIEVGAESRQLRHSRQDPGGSAARDAGFCQADPAVSSRHDDRRRRLRFWPGNADGWLIAYPTIAFEPNVVPGFANRVIARTVKAAAVQFEKTCSYFPNCQATGVPVRREFFNIPSRPQDAPPTLLVFGGSQGAHAINQAVLDSLPKLAKEFPGLSIIHQTGEKDYVEAQAAYLKQMVPAEVSAFIDDMPGAFGRADLVLCRSGASTVAEITAAGKPAIFVPLPTAADDHQRQNAEVLVSGNAARLLPQAELSGIESSPKSACYSAIGHDWQACPKQPAVLLTPTRPPELPPWLPSSLAFKPNTR